MQTEYILESGVPIPPTKQGARYPFDKMAIGQSFFVPAGGKPLSRVQSLLIVSARQWKMQTGTKATFITRQDKEHGGVRIWRTQ
jgi:hypothetical protein